MAWRIAKSLDVLRNEVNSRWPDRNKASDGVIGDAAHAASASDHNPNPAGVVCAFDITHDPAGCDGNYVAELLRTCRHPDVKYVIWDHRLFSSYGATPWEWRPYSGADPHTNHVHVSVGVGHDGQSLPPYDDLDPWGVFPAIGDDDMDAKEFHDLVLGGDPQVDGTATWADVIKLTATLARDNAAALARLEQKIDAFHGPTGAGVHGDVQATIHFP